MNGGGACARHAVVVNGTLGHPYLRRESHADACQTETTARPIRRPAPGSGLRCARRPGDDGTGCATDHGTRRRRANDRAEAGRLTPAGSPVRGALAVGGRRTRDQAGELAGCIAKRRAGGRAGRAVEAHSTRFG